ncbi:hypothetical protein Rs2_10292 [Raphanus sativus]|uniref:Insulin-degrading enzyme-like 1, peroxisomal isoform X1 n=2 Tax=Raphanus sativus TaxID=3726 RepID=A0A6J0MVC4_RAPSA|nr:insulin-degrading enzyme-like 1, peroxisomal isoform X1 [Raphanus sativus]XP_056860547.1 insulin-degrading enzyme-like 1, peroxisomal isoform X1 [Raphanus sativus]KAJ4906634.1 hypothetical protein Rs2_10292 [Raphanus sativus]
MGDEEFKSNVTALIDMKLENTQELEGGISVLLARDSGTLEFNRKEAEVAALSQLQKQELIDFFQEYVKIGATRKKSLSIRVYGNGSKHLKERQVTKRKSLHHLLKSMTFLVSEIPSNFTGRSEDVDNQNSEE